MCEVLWMFAVKLCTNACLTGSWGKNEKNTTAVPVYYCLIKPDPFYINNQVYTIVNAVHNITAMSVSSKWSECCEVMYICTLCS